jgi:hypothetical protein
MTQVVITNASGYTPIEVYIADFNGNYKTYLGSITGTTNIPVPPEQTFLPNSFFNTTPSIMLILRDSNGCEKFKLIPCEVCDITIIITENNVPIASECGIIFIA